MIYTTLKTIQENIIERNRPFWRIYQRDEKNMLADSSDIEGLNAKRSAEILATEIEALNGSGFVIVKLYAQPLTKGGNNTGILTYNVKIGADDDQGVKGNSGGFNNFGLISGFHTEIMNLNMKLLQQQNDAAIKDLERKYEEKNKVGAIDPTLKEILNVAKTALFQSGVNKNAPVHNPPVQNNQQANRPINGIDDKKEFIDLVTRWHKLDPHYLEAMKAIVFFAQNEPDLYKSQVSMLISQYNTK